MAKKLRTYIERTVIVLVGILCVLSPATAGARGYSNLSPQELEQLGIYFVYGDYTCGTNASAATTSSNTGNSNAGTWNSGVTAPYILESIMIEALKDIAAKRGVEATKTVTQEHVIALVAFAIGEGGDINNNDIFNPLNTGINAPDLTVGGEHVVNGVQSFKSFDAGVEALARVMTGNNQRRLSDILIRPESTAEDFMKALTYYGNYPGNKLWAEASQPPHQDSYYKERLDLVAQTRSNYNFYAALQIGLPEFEQKTKKTDASKLQFHPAGSAAPPASTASGAGGDGGSTACTCSPTGTTTGKNNVIVIDPGHSGNSTTVTDATGLKDYDYPNHPEMEDVFDIATIVKAKLELDGYKVYLTKDTVGATKTLRERADVANGKHAALALSIHDQAGSNGGLPFASANNVVYSQVNGLYRQKPDGTKVTFNNTDVANLSQTYSHNFQVARQAAEGHSVTVKNDAGSDIGNRGLAPGNIWMVQLFSTVPWVYNEAGGNSAGQAGLSQTDKQKYAKGLIDGVEASVKIDKAATGNTDGNSSGCETASDGSIVKEAARLAWASGSHGPRMKDATDNYQKTEPSPKGAGFTSDNAGDPAFSDCGVFVATVMISSGADPGYQKRQTSAQLKYLQGSSKFVEVREPGNKDISSTKYLAPGDIMVTTSGTGHTYIYSGKQPSGGKDAYSASYFGHVPQASPFYQESAGGGQHFAAFRLKTTAPPPTN